MNYYAITTASISFHMKLQQQQQECHIQYPISNIGYTIYHIPYIQYPIYHILEILNLDWKLEIHATQEQKIKANWKPQNPLVYEVRSSSYFTSYTYTYSLQPIAPKKRGGGGAGSLTVAVKCEVCRLREICDLVSLVLVHN